MTDPVADRLAGLATNFFETITDLPDKEQEELRHGQADVAEKRRSAQSDERLLRLRLK